MYSEIAFAAANSLGLSERLSLEDLRVERPLVWAEGTRMVLRVVLALQPSGHRVEISSRRADTDQPFTLHARGTVRPRQTTAPSFVLAEVRQRVTHEVPVTNFYVALKSRGLDLGPRFRGVTQLWQAPDEVLARVALPPDLVVEQAAYDVHPALLEACAQIVSILDGSDRPFSIAGASVVHLWAKASRVVWSYARVRTSPDQERRFDICLADETGQVIGQISGVSLR